MSISEIIILIAIIFMALWRRDIFFYLTASPLAIVTGLTWRGYYPTTNGMVEGLVIIGVGVYCLIMGIYNIVKKFN